MRRALRYVNQYREARDNPNGLRIRVGDIELRSYSITHKQLEGDAPRIMMPAGHEIFSLLQQAVATTAGREAVQGIHRRST